MSAPRPNPDEPIPEEPHDFSLVLGGLLFQLWRRTRLSGPGLQLLPRRVIALVLLAWVPPLVLSIVEGNAWGGNVKLPFFRDVDMHARVLLALPLLITAEVGVYRRMQPLVGLFLDQHLIPRSEMARFQSAIASAMRLRNAIPAELILLALAYIVGAGLLWRAQVALDVTAWYGVPVNGRLHPSLAGWWLGLVTLPLFQFLLLRWYYRLGIWARFLWQVSRLDLKIVPTHPDRAGGLGFMDQMCLPFSSLLLAQGIVLSGSIADRILFTGVTLPDFTAELIALVVLIPLTVLGPMLIFAPRLVAARRAGLLGYGRLAESCVSEFDDKWVRSAGPVDRPLLGSPDLRSLADMGNSYQLVKNMLFVPVTRQTMAFLVGDVVLPLLPLVLTMVSVGALMQRLLKIIF